MVRRGSAGAVRRALGFLAFLPVASRAPLYTRLMWELVRDERTPAGRKALLAGALGYLLLGRDLIPDDIPVLGGLDVAEVADDGRLRRVVGFFGPLAAA